MTLAVCYHHTGRSRYCAQAMAAGIRRCGGRVELRQRWHGETDGDVVVAYGWRNLAMFEAYRAAGKPFVYLDMGYWHRRPRGAIFRGYHKVVVNARDPFAYFRCGHSDDRLRQLRIRIEPWRTGGDHILLAGMSAKSAWHYGYGPEAWETKAIARLRKHTSRPIVYRPKPSWPGARPIAGADFADPKAPLASALDGAWAVVTHHSNVGIDALVAGVPVYSVKGLASTMSMRIEQIEDPPFTPDRAGFLADVAYCQWNSDEMESGSCWRHLRRQELVP